MVLTASTMLKLGTQAPDFSLPDVVTGKTISPKNFSGKKALLVMFICNHCPYVVHIRKGLAQFGKDYQTKDIGIVAISSNDAKKYSDDVPSELAKMAQSLGFTFAFCYDESQEIAKKYTAACTPDFFLFDKDRKLVYRGQFDDSRPDNGKPVTGKELREAVDAVLAGNSVSVTQKPSMGCNIKWKAGNEPNYFGGHQQKILN